MLATANRRAKAIKEMEVSFDTAMFEAVPDNAQEAIEAHAMKGLYKNFMTKLDEFYPSWLEARIEAGKDTNYGIPITGEGKAFGATVKPETVKAGITNVLKANEALKANWRVFQHTEDEVTSVWVAHL
jgi:hypothetical protein